MAYQVQGYYIKNQLAVPEPGSQSVEVDQDHLNSIYRHYHGVGRKMPIYLLTVDRRLIPIYGHTRTVILIFFNLLPLRLFVSC